MRRAPHKRTPKFDLKAPWYLSKKEHPARQRGARGIANWVWLAFRVFAHFVIDIYSISTWRFCEGIDVASQGGSLVRSVTLGWRLCVTSSVILGLSIPSYDRHVVCGVELSVCINHPNSNVFAMQYYKWSKSEVSETMIHSAIFPRRIQELKDSRAFLTCIMLIAEIYLCLYTSSGTSFRFVAYQNVRYN